MVPVDATGRRYGLAWYVDSVAGLQLPWHLGSVQNGGSHVVLVPEASLAVGVMGNVSRPLDPRHEVAESITAAALLFGDAPLEAPRTVVLAPTRPGEELLRAVPGVYASAAGPVTVTARDGALMGSVHGHAFELLPAGGVSGLIAIDPIACHALRAERSPRNGARRTEPAERSAQKGGGANHEIPAGDGSSRGRTNDPTLGAAVMNAAGRPLSRLTVASRVSPPLVARWRSRPCS